MRFLFLPHFFLNSLLGSILVCTTACDLFLPVVMTDAVVAPYPQSELIDELVWDEPETILRDAKGSDNWPMTWADDGHLYTAYGDGWGFFNPRPGDKLSLGYARIEDGPEDFQGFNIPSAGEQSGQGRAGKKASGLLMVDSILYMWVRNANNAGEGCQLATSTDYAQTWAWADWTFEELGYCTFINYGKNYADAIDDYIYMVTPNGPSAYDFSDSFALTRVPKDDILARDSYEFLVAVEDGQPRWSNEIEERGSVFSFAGHSRRSGITYNIGLQRFIWWQGHPSKSSEDERFSGGIGVYEAPTPWGPWKTVYFANDWDVGPGDAASFPTKWMSDDGLTMYLAFAGDDYFSVRRARLRLKE